MNTECGEWYAMTRSVFLNIVNLMFMKTLQLTGKITNDNVNDINIFISNFTWRMNDIARRRKITIVKFA